MFVNDVLLAAPRLLALLSLQAEDAAPAEEAPSFLNSILFPVVVMGILFYVIMLGPERKQRKQREEMLATLGKGDRVLTTSGMHGVVTQVTDDVVTLQVADGVRIKFARSAVQGMVGETDAAKKPAEKAEAGKGS